MLKNGRGYSPVLRVSERRQPRTRTHTHTGTHGGAGRDAEAGLLPGKAPGTDGSPHLAANEHSTGALPWVLDPGLRPSLRDGPAKSVSEIKLPKHRPRKYRFHKTTQENDSAVSRPGLGRFPRRREMATHSSILAWSTLWTEKTGRLQSMGSQRVGNN